MTWSYVAPSATPDYSGIFEIPTFSLRIGNVTSGGVEPSFHPLIIPPLMSTCPIRYNVTPIPRGSSVSDPVVDSWQFDVTGWFLVDNPDDVWAAFDYLCGVVCLDNEWMGAQINAPTWSAARGMTVRKAGPVTMGFASPDGEVDEGEMNSGYRRFRLPLIAADPIKYGLTQHSTAITTGTTVNNAGNARVPYIARFDGPNTSFIQVDKGGAVRLDYALGSGEYVEITTRDGSVVATNVSADLNPYISVDAGARLLSRGNNSFTKSSGGSGTATVKWYDGWE